MNAIMWKYIPAFLHDIILKFTGYRLVCRQNAGIVVGYYWTNHWRPDA